MRGAGELTHAIMNDKCRPAARRRTWRHLFRGISKALQKSCAPGDISITTLKRGARRLAAQAGRQAGSADPVGNIQLRRAHLLCARQMRVGRRMAPHQRELAARTDRPEACENLRKQASDPHHSEQARPPRLRFDSFFTINFLILVQMCSLLR